MPPTIHPPPSEFTPEQLAQDPILRYFHYAHLPPGLRDLSAACCELAHFIVNATDRSAERTAGLRKLLEAKDCFVRAALPNAVDTPTTPTV